MKLVRSIFLFLSVVLVQSAFAQEYQGITLSPGFSYSSYEDRGGRTASNQKQSATLFDIRLGYQFSSGLYLGVNYMSNNYRDEGIATSSESNVTGLGPQIGYFLNGWHLMVTYYVQSELKYNPSLRYTAGSGTQFDLGYRWMMGHFGIGAYLSTRNLTYTELYVASASTSMAENRQWNRVYPCISLWIVP